MLKNLILVCIISAIAFSMVDCRGKDYGKGNRKNSVESGESGESGELNAACTSNSTCETRKTGLVCIGNLCM